MANPKLQTFRNPVFSLWQSALHQTLLKFSAEGKVKLPAQHRGLGATAAHPYMLASVQAIADKESGAALPVATPSTAVASTVLECAKLALEIAWDEVFNRAKVPALKNELSFSQCDPFWAECLTAYAAFLASAQSQPYHVYRHLSDYVLTGYLQDTAKVALISDWGTGENDALVLLQQVATLAPDVVIHLGDIYYSGLPSEDSDHITQLIREVWPSHPPLFFTLDGNHDRYAGSGGGYYQLIAGLNNGQPAQPNSYFALRNHFWQFLATDTGYHDTNPFTVSTNVTYLEHTEIDWHLDKIRNNRTGVDRNINASGVRGTVLLSHHPLMSYVKVGDSPDGQPLAVNPNLASAFSSVFPLIDFWLWGHEHNLLIFQPYSLSPGQPLPPGRCIGAGAVPMFPPAPTAPSNLVLPPSETKPPQVEPNTSLGNNGNVFNHSYALVTLNGPSLRINYYQFDSSDAVPGKPPAAQAMAFSDHTAQPRAASQSR